MNNIPFSQNPPLPLEIHFIRRKNANKSMSFPRKRRGSERHVQNSRKEELIPKLKKCGKINKTAVQ